MYVQSTMRAFGRTKKERHGKKRKIKSNKIVCMCRASVFLLAFCTKFSNVDQCCVNAMRQTSLSQEQRYAEFPIGHLVIMRSDRVIFFLSIGQVAGYLLTSVYALCIARMLYSLLRKWHVERRREKKFPTKNDTWTLTWSCGETKLTFWNRFMHQHFTTFDHNKWMCICVWKLCKNSHRTEVTKMIVEHRLHVAVLSECKTQMNLTAHRVRCRFQQHSIHWQCILSTFSGIEKFCSAFCSWSIHFIYPVAPMQQYCE